MTIRIETRHTFPVPVSEAFADITDMSNWATYWPDFVRIDDPADAGGVNRATESRLCSSFWAESAS